jgi:hypothetical protein
MCDNDQNVTHRPWTGNSKTKERLMKYLINGTLRPDKSREEFLARIQYEPGSAEAWDLVRTGRITERGFKIGQRLGFICVVEAESEDAALAVIATIPLLQEDWFTVEVDPISPFRSDLRER